MKPPQRATPARISAVGRPPITLTRGDDSGTGCLRVRDSKRAERREKTSTAPDGLPFAELPVDPEQDHACILHHGTTEGDVAALLDALRDTGTLSGQS